MKEKRNKKILYLSVILVVCLAGAAVMGIMGCRLIRHERNQSQRISEIAAQMAVLSARMAVLETTDTGQTEAEIFRKECEENSLGGGINYLAIGNSITKHGIVDYWWTECGMAASKPERDYFHLVTAALQEYYAEKICSLAYNFSAWEMLATDRAQVLEVLGGYLSENLNFITVQLGENATDLSTWESDFEGLLEYIKRYAPKAQIIVIGDFWEYGERDQMKKRAAENLGVAYVDLAEIKGKEEYMAGLGTSVYGDDGAWHKVEHAGVAAHPGDKGMEYIATRILEKITQ